LLALFEAEAFYHGLLQQMKPGSIILNRGQKEQGKECYRQGIHALVSRWHKTVEVDGDFVEK
jgi:hypothetical protein